MHAGWEHNQLGRSAFGIWLFARLAPLRACPGRAFRQQVHLQPVLKVSQHNGNLDCVNWEIRFENAKKAARYSIEGQETAKLLIILFDRLYVLRNQLVHGSATYNSRVNRKQVRDWAALLLIFMPVVIDTMMSNAAEDWGAPYYPVVE